MASYPLTIEGIDARLAQIEAERKLLLGLRELYGAAAPVQIPATTETRMARAPKSQTLVHSGRSVAQEVLSAVSGNPGIRQGALIDILLRSVETNSTRPRKNMANIIGQAVIRRRIERRPDGGYYLTAEGARLLG
ncbi:MAG: hypothetical protein HY944_07835 [Gemmatimonadetes bacterium]|nr:hypothetical protein [Gemmatimonadota bacterium]